MVWQYVYPFRQHTWTWQTDGHCTTAQAMLMQAYCSKNKREFSEMWSIYYYIREAELTTNERGHLLHRAELCGWSHWTDWSTESGPVMGCQTQSGTDRLCPRQHHHNPHSSTQLILLKRKASTVTQSTVKIWTGNFLCSTQLKQCWLHALSNIKWLKYLSETESTS